MSRPQLWVISGPNGAGKTTLTRHHFADRIPVVNPDDIAVELNPDHRGETTVLLQAGRVALARRQKHLEAGESFAVETTLTGKGELALIRRAVDKGYKINLMFIGISSAQVSAGRVAERVRRGGHAVPLDDIFRRFDRSLNNLSSALAMADRAMILDNSSARRRLLLSIEDGRVKHAAKTLPDWAKTAVPAGLQQVKTKTHRVR
jgi:predicted ABC-type ATPase